MADRKLFLKFPFPIIALVVIGIFFTFISTDTDMQSRKNYAIFQNAYSEVLGSKSEGWQRTQKVSEWFRVFGLNREVEVSWNKLPSGNLIFKFSKSEEKDTKIDENWFLIHGYMEHTGFLIDHIQHYLKTGKAVYSIDLPLHGLNTDSNFWDANSFYDYGRDLKESLELIEEKVSMICHSTGCVGVLDLLLGSDNYLKEKFYVQNAAFLANKLEKLFLLAPLIRVKFHSLLTMAAGIVPIKSIPRNTNPKSKRLQELRNLDPASAQNIPLTWFVKYTEWEKKRDWQKTNLNGNLIFDPKDGVVDVSYAKKIKAKLLPNFKITEIEGADHYVWHYSRFFDLTH